MEQLEVINGLTCILQTTWDKTYQLVMDDAREWIKANQAEILEKYNEVLFKECWDKYATGNISSYEMEALCFYYHEHELINVNTDKYGIVDFFSLSPDPDVDYYFKRNGHDIPIYKIRKVIGTVIGKNDARSSISLLTTSGVITVKFTKEYFAMYNRQMSERQPSGKGIGIGNISKRIHMLYENGGFEIESRQNEGTVVKITIPQEVVKGEVEHV